MSDRSLLKSKDMKGILNKDTLQTEERSLLEDHLIPGVSGAVEKYLGRKILSLEAMTEYYNGDNTPTLQLKQWPIISITSVHDKRNNSEGWEASDYDYALTEYTDFIVLTDEGQLRHVDGWWIDSSPYFYKVIYTAGYALADIPPDLLLGVKTWIAILFQKVESNLHGVDTHVMGDEAFTYDVATIPKQVIELLKPYRRLYG